MSTTTDREPVEVSAGIIYRKGLILAAQRPDDSAWGGYWEFPGGKKEGSETPEETLRRELAEELGINATNFELLKTIDHDYEDYTVRLSFFLVTSFKGIPCPSEDQNTRWIPPEDLGEFQFLPADQEMLKILMSEKSMLPWQNRE